MQENNHELDYKNLGVDILNERLRVFYASLRTKQGTEYSRSALLGIRAAISRHLTSPPFSRHISLMSDRACMSSNHVMLGSIKICEKAGKDVTGHMQAVSEGDIEKLYSSGVFDLDKPETLQNKVFWDVLLHFGRRGQEGLHDLKSNSYVKCTDNAGHQYYKMAYNEANKTQHGVNSKENEQETRMYSRPGEQNCPVSNMDLYLGKLNPKCKAFFQQHLQYPKEECWYAVQAMGKNKLASMMARISKNVKALYKSLHKGNSGHYPEETGRRFTILYLSDRTP